MEVQSLCVSGAFNVNLARELLCVGILLAVVVVWYLAVDLIAP